MLNTLSVAFRSVSRGHAIRSYQQCHLPNIQCHLYMRAHATRSRLDKRHMAADAEQSPAPTASGDSDSGSSTSSRQRSGDADCKGSGNSSNAGDPHVPVMLNEVLDAFKPLHVCVYVDATLGAGGHASAMMAAHPVSS